METIQSNLSATKAIIDKEKAIKKLREEGVQEIERIEEGVLATVFISNEFLSQFADFIEFQNYLESK